MRFSTRSATAAFLGVVLLGGPAASSPAEPEGPGHQDVSAAGGRAPGVGSMMPSSGAWFGVSPDWGNDSLAAYSRRLGHAPAVAVTFTGFPMSAQEQRWLDGAVDQAAGVGSMLVLTLEPRRGMDSVTAARSRALATRLERYNQRGVPVFVRFAHEMNGSWYPWGQQPRDYVQAFRRLATAIHSGTSRTAMMWAPNYGGGYPFAGGTYQARPGDPGFADLDTDGDGRITGTDDPYAPYWPGRRFVDWVGMSAYHWGNAYPWGENEIPEPHKFTDLLRGEYVGSVGDERAVPDFYQEYGAAMRLPVAVIETSALYVEGRGGAGELAIKQAWWRQVFAPGNHRRLPWLRMVNWFEWRKQEPEVSAVVDWTATRTSRIRTPFRKALPAWARYASGTDQRTR